MRLLFWPPTTPSLANAEAFCHRPGVALSLDVFDTAITRIVSRPDHLHLIVARRLASAAVSNLSPDSWRAVRIKAEAVVRKRCYPNEIDLNQIFSQISLDLGWSPELAHLALSVELDLERAVTRPILEIQRIFRDFYGLDGKVIFLSDTYFERDFIRNLLEDSGYEISRSDIYASSALGTSKHQGTIYNDPRLNSYRGTVLFHIGDHPQSDLRNARAAGWTAQLYSGARLTRREERLAHGCNDLLTGSLIAGASRASRLSSEAGASAPNGLSSAASSVAAPLITAFVGWTLLQAQAHGIKRLYYLARDGQILTQLASMMVPHMGLDIEPRYLLASRRALYLPSLAKDNDPTVNFGLHPSEASLREQFSALEIPNEVIETLVESTAYSLKESQSLKLRDHLDKRDFDAFICRADERHHALLSYLDQERFFSQNQVGIIDLGWKGNLQSRLMKALGTNRACEVHGFYFNLTTTPELLNGRVNLFSPGDSVNAPLLETFCRADHGTALAYREDAAGAWVDVAEPPHAKEMEAIVAHQQIVAKYAETLMEGLSLANLTLEDVLPSLTSVALDAFRDFARRPTAVEAEEWGRVLHAGNEVHGDARELAPRLSSIGLIGAFSRHSHNIYWRTGSLARSKALISPILGLIVELNARRHSRYR